MGEFPPVSRTLWKGGGLLLICFQLESILLRQLFSPLQFWRVPPEPPYIKGLPKVDRIRNGPLDASNQEMALDSR